MPKVESSLLVVDPSFLINIAFRNPPYEMAFRVPEGNLKVSLIVPKSEDFTSDSNYGGIELIAQSAIEEAEKGVVPFIGITCMIEVVLEQKVTRKTLNSYVEFRELLNSPQNREKSTGEMPKLDVKEVGSVQTNTSCFKHEKGMFEICRRYLKRFLLSLRERGNVCKLRLSDYGGPSTGDKFGLFGKYYFLWTIKDENDTSLWSSEPFGLVMQKGKKGLFRTSFSVPIAENALQRRDSMVDPVVWQQITNDMKTDFNPDVAKTFLLDAQDEAFSMNLNSAIISTAVACEVLTKRYISEESKRVGNEFYDFVIDKAREVSVVELLDIALKSLVGHSIRQENSSLWNDLRKLFQVRNKIVHEGKRYYMSRTGKRKYSVDARKTIHFIDRIYELIEILDGY